MAIPSVETAEALLADAAAANPGPWVDHSRYTARAAGIIATAWHEMDPTAAYVLGLLHDIGRGAGVMGMRHVVCGYRHMRDLGYAKAARICMTHSFPMADINCYVGQIDCDMHEVALIDSFLAEVEYDDYDRLIRLCDAVCLPTGFCRMERRRADIASRYGTNRLTDAKWRTVADVKHQIDAKVGQCVYELLEIPPDHSTTESGYRTAV